MAEGDITSEEGADKSLGGIVRATEFSTYVRESVRFQVVLLRDALEIKKARSAADPALHDLEWRIFEPSETAVPTDPRLVGLLAPQFAYLPGEVLLRWFVRARDILGLLEGNEPAGGMLGDAIGQLAAAKERSLSDLKRFVDIVSEGKHRAYLVNAHYPNKPVEIRFTHELPKTTKDHLNLA